MIIERKVLIYARDSYDGGIGNSESWQWARWTLFLICILAVVLFIVSILGLNRKRSQVGIAPIRGTGWITPPSYRQSQREYNRRGNGNDGDYVPQYTATANENDLGYYDDNGEFHLNSKADLYPPPALEETNEGGRSNDSASEVSLERPANAVTRSRRNSADLEAEFDRDFGRGRPNREAIYTPTTNHSSSLEEQVISTPERAKLSNN